MMNSDNFISTKTIRYIFKWWMAMQYPPQAWNMGKNWTQYLAIYMLRFSHHLSFIVSIVIRVLWNWRVRMFAFNRPFLRFIQSLGRGLSWQERLETWLLPKFAVKYFLLNKKKGKTPVFIQMALKWNSRGNKVSIGLLLNPTYLSGVYKLFPPVLPRFLWLLLSLMCQGMHTVCRYTLWLHLCFWHPQRQLMPSAQWPVRSIPDH